MHLLPQLPLPFAEPLASQYSVLSVAECRCHREMQHPNRIFSPVGGTRITEGEYAGLVGAIAGLAEAAGYPADSLAMRAKFDVELAVFLGRRLNISDNEASKAGVWNFMACVALPDLVRWRFPSAAGTPANRFLSGPKNLFERLLWRSRAYFDPENTTDPYWLVREIGEDESVGIMERTTLSGIRSVVPMILRTLVETAAANPQIPRSELMRDAMKRLLRLSSIVAFEALDHGSLKAVCASVFRESVGPTSAKGAAAPGAKAPPKTQGAVGSLPADKLSDLAAILRQNQVRRGGR